MAIIPYENIYRSGNQVDELYRSGNEIVKMYRSGDLIYQKLSSVPDDSIIPLTFEIITSGTILWKKSSQVGGAMAIQYSLNGGDWISITSTFNGTPISVSTGDILQLKGTNSTYYADTIHNYFDSTANYYVYGNIMSLIYGDNFIGQTTLEASNTFNRLFQNSTGLTNHSVHKLLLPATTLTNRCYYGMFYGCASLTRAPELPAPTLVEDCYRWMFYDCTSLNYIKCLATDISASNCTNEWVRNVASTGTFVKPSSMSSWTRDVSGIPAGWTVKNEGGVEPTGHTAYVVVDGTRIDLNKTSDNIYEMVFAESYSSLTLYYDNKIVTASTLTLTIENSPVAYEVNFEVAGIEADSYGATSINGISFYAETNEVYIGLS